MDANLAPQEQETHHVPKSTLIIFWLFIGYIFLSFVAAVYFITTTNSKIFNLNNIISLTDNQTTASIDIPICFSRTNQTALRSSILENEYGGKIQSLQEDISSESAEFHSTITLQRGSNLFTYFITKEEIKKLTFFDPREGGIKYRTIQGLRVGDTAIIRETLNLRRPPEDSKTKIEIEIL